ncbi:septum formation initiator family protein [Candidatus Daviesbacteria bacterium]|nr:septum formation initiator family protein [Candidatus Daviesbacteria bacterium]
MIKKISLGLIILVSLIIGYNLITQAVETAKSGERLSQAAEVVYKLEIKNRQLKKELSLIQSPEFIEQEVRNKLGFAKKGETVVVIPEEKLKTILGVSSSAQIRLPNWLGWLKLFFK